MALGDSLGWGYQPNDLNRGPGDKGYVRAVAGWIGTRQGGVRPRLINLSVPGETAASFFDTTQVGAFLNSNYPLIGRRSQAQTFGERVTAETAAGRTVTHVTYSLGGNDLLGLLNGSFLALPFDEQQRRTDAAITAADSQVGQALTLVRQRLPGATLAIPGYYNCYGAFPGSPEDRISQYAIPRLNAMLQRRATEFGGVFAPVYAVFVGRELTFTWIGQNDVHCRDAGYAAMGQRVVFALSAPRVGLAAAVKD